MKTLLEIQLQISQMISDAEKEERHIAIKINNLGFSLFDETQFHHLISEQNRIIGKINGLKASWEIIRNA